MMLCFDFGIFHQTGMPIFSLSVFILLVFACFPVAAENWQTARVNEESRIEIDAATLVRNDSEGSVRAWERETFTKPRQAIPGDFYFKSVKSLALHHCTKRTTTYLYRGYYEEDGREIKSITTTADLVNIEYLIPGSPEELKLAFACNRKAGSAKPSKSPEPPAAAKEDKPSTPPSPPVAAKTAPSGKPAPTTNAPAKK